MKLSGPQKKVLKGASYLGGTNFRGHQFKTIESLAKRGLIYYRANLQCRTCGSFDCQKHHGGTRWIIWAEATDEGRQVLKNQGGK